MAGDRGLFYLADCPNLFGKFQQYEVGKAAAGASVIAITSNPGDWKAGHGIIVRAGGPRQALCTGADAGWAAACPDAAISQDTTNKRSAVASLRIDVAPTYVMGTEIATYSFPSQDWSAFHEIRLSLQLGNASNFGKFPPGGLVLVVKDSQGRVVSRSGMDGNWGVGPNWGRLCCPLDQTFPLSDVASVTLVADLLNDGTGKWHTLAGFDQSGPHYTTGSGWTMWVDEVALCTDLVTKVMGVGATTGSLTLADPLQADLPETPLSGSSYYRGALPDDAPALNAWIATLPDYCEVVFENQHCSCASPVVVRGKQGILWNGRNSVGAAGNNLGYANPAFFYTGPGGGYFFLLDHTRDHTWHGLTWDCPMRAPCSAVEIDMLPGSSGTTTGMTFQRCFVNGPFPVERYTGHTFAGFAVGRVSSANCEFMEWDACGVSAARTYPGGGFCWYIGPHTNIKTLVFKGRCYSGYGAVGIKSDGGSFHAYQMTGNYHGKMYEVNGSGEPIVIQGGNTEWCGGLGYFNTSFGVTILGERHSALIAGCGSKWGQSAAIKLGSGGGYVELLANKIFPNSPAIPTPVLLDPTSVAAHIRSLGNYYGYDWNNSNFNMKGGGQWSITSDDKWTVSVLNDPNEVWNLKHLYLLDDYKDPVTGKLAPRRRHGLGRGSSGRYPGKDRHLLYVDRDGDGVRVGGPLQLDGGLVPSRVTLAADPAQALTTWDLTNVNSYRDAKQVITYLDATNGDIEVIINNAADYLERYGQHCSPLFWFKRKDRSTHMVRIRCWTRSQTTQPIEGADANNYLYIAPGQSVRLHCDGSDPLSQWWQV